MERRERVWSVERRGDESAVARTGDGEDDTVRVAPRGRTSVVLGEERRGRRAEFFFSRAFAGGGLLCPRDEKYVMPKMCFQVDRVGFDRTWLRDRE